MKPEERAQAFLDMYDVKGYNPIYVGMLAAMIREAEADEREACAKIAETAPDLLQNSTFEGVAAAIRARQKEA